MSLASDTEIGFGPALRTWRRARGLSQLDLALAAGSSPRHVSFLETNRARPSREMVQMLADAMVLPRAARNALLVAAGFAPMFPVTPLDAAALGPFRSMMAEMMDRHAPNPALLADRHWTIRDANATARLLLDVLAGESGEANVVSMLTDPVRAPEVVLNLGEVLEEMLGRIRLEALEMGADPVYVDQLRALEAALERHPPPRRSSVRNPLVPLILKGPSGPLKFLSAIAHFGTSEDVTVRDLRLELLFPADDATRATMAALA